MLCYINMMLKIRELNIDTMLFSLYSPYSKCTHFSINIFPIFPCTGSNPRSESYLSAISLQLLLVQNSSRFSSSFNTLIFFRKFRSFSQIVFKFEFLDVSSCQDTHYVPLVFLVEIIIVTLFKEGIWRFLTIKLLFLPFFIFINS